MVSKRYLGNKLFDLYSPPPQILLFCSPTLKLAPLGASLQRGAAPQRAVGSRKLDGLFAHTHSHRPKTQVAIVEPVWAGRRNGSHWRPMVGRSVIICRDLTSLWEHECDRGLFALLEDMRVGIDSELDFSGYIEFGVIYKVPAESWWRHKLNFTWINMALFGRIRE